MFHPKKDRLVTNQLLPISGSSEFALYIHIPFCVTKCPYCDFNSYALDREYQPEKLLADEPKYIEALCHEMQLKSKEDSWRDKKISSIFFGGGTPSLLQADSINTILSSTKKHWHWSEEIEITLECNPGTLREKLGEQKLDAFHKTGVNRLSFGAQSIDAEKLKALGRLHLVEDTHHSLRAAKKAGFERLSIDLIYGLPNETNLSWRLNSKRY